MSEEIIPGFDELLETRRAEKAEAIRFARLGMGVHDSELVYADEAGRIGTSPEWKQQDPFCGEWGMFIPKKEANA